MNTATDTKTGTVKFFNEQKGYGFITCKDDGEEYFVHVTGLKDKITKDDEVTFELEESKKGMNAVNVRIAE